MEEEKETQHNNFQELPMLTFIKKKVNYDFEFEITEHTVRGYTMDECLEAMKKLKRMFEEKKK